MELKASSFHLKINIRQLREAASGTDAMLWLESRFLYNKVEL